MRPWRFPGMRPDGSPKQISQSSPNCSLNFNFDISIKIIISNVVLKLAFPFPPPLLARVTLALLMFLRCLSFRKNSINASHDRLLRWSVWSRSKTTVARANVRMSSMLATLSCGSVLKATRSVSELALGAGFDQCDDVHASSLSRVPR